MHYARSRDTLASTSLASSVTRSSLRRAAPEQDQKGTLPAASATSRRHRQPIPESICPFGARAGPESHAALPTPSNVLVEVNTNSILPPTIVIIPLSNQEKRSFDLRLA